MVGSSGREDSRGSSRGARDVSIFVSSTFLDMQAERDALRDVVLPRLREFASAYGVAVEIVDLRWGIDTSGVDEGEQDGRILRSCMGEIDRCRPFFLAMLGDRYGYVSPGSSEARSVTEREIDHALAKDGHGDAFLCYVRTIANPEALPAALRTTFTGDGDGERRLNDLKARLAAGHPEAMRRYRVTVGDDGRYGLDEFCAMVERDIESRLTREWGPRPEDGRALDAEMDRAWRYARNLAASFVGRARRMDDLMRRCLGPRGRGHGGDGVIGRDGGDDGGLLVVQGASGAGKTSLMAGLAAVLANRRDRIDPTLTVVPVFCGLTASTTDQTGLMRLLTWELTDAAGRDAALEERLAGMDHERLRLTLRESMERAGRHGRVVVLVDALDQLEGRGDDPFAWLGEGAPSGCVVVCSSIPGIDERALRRVGGSPIELEPLDRADMMDLIRSICASHHKELQEPVVEAVVAKAFTGDVTAMPLYVSLVVRFLLAMDEAGFRQADGLASDLALRPIDAITMVMLGRIRVMPNTCEGMVVFWLSRTMEVMGDDGGDMIRVVLAIASSRFGLREEDLAGIMPMCGSSFDAANFAWFRQLLLGDFVQRGDLAWDFAHQSFRRALEGRYGETIGAVNHAVEAYMLGRTLDALDDYRRGVRPDGHEPFIDREIMHHLHMAGDAKNAANVIGVRVELGQGADAERFAVYLPALARITAKEVEEAGTGPDARSKYADTFLMRIVAAFHGRDSVQRYMMGMAFDRFHLGRQPAFRDVPDSYRLMLATAMLGVFEEAPVDGSMMAMQALGHCAIAEYSHDEDVKRRHFQRAIELAQTWDMRPVARAMGLGVNLEARVAQTYGDWLRGCDRHPDPADGESADRLYRDYLDETRAAWHEAQEHGDEGGDRRHEVLADYLTGLDRMIRQAIASGRPREGSPYVQEMASTMEAYERNLPSDGGRGPRAERNLLLYHLLSGAYWAAVGDAAQAAPHDRRVIETAIRIQTLWPGQEGPGNICLALTEAYGRLINEGGDQIAWLIARADPIARVFESTLPALRADGVKVSGLVHAFATGRMPQKAMDMAYAAEVEDDSAPTDMHGWEDGVRRDLEYAMYKDARGCMDQAEPVLAGTVDHLRRMVALGLGEDRNRASWAAMEAMLRRRLEAGGAIRLAGKVTGDGPSSGRFVDAGTLDATARACLRTGEDYARIAGVYRLEPAAALGMLYLAWKCVIKLWGSHPERTDPNLVGRAGLMLGWELGDARRFAESVRLFSLAIAAMYSVSQCRAEGDALDDPESMMWLFRLYAKRAQGQLALGLRDQCLESIRLAAACHDGLPRPHDPSDDDLMRLLERIARS